MLTLSNMHMFGYGLSLLQDLGSLGPGMGASPRGVKLSERELLEAVERQANNEKQEQKHQELIAKHEHNLVQQRAMLESVRTQLADVRDTVGALRALVSETREPPNNPVVPPLPREPPLMNEGTILPLAVRKNSCLWMLPACITRRLILRRIWRKRLGLSSPKGNEKRAAHEAERVVFFCSKRDHEI